MGGPPETNQADGGSGNGNDKLDNGNQLNNDNGTELTDKYNNGSSNAAIESETGSGCASLEPMGKEEVVGW